MKRPMAYQPCTTAPVQYALKYSPDDLGETCEIICEVARVLMELAATCAAERDELVRMCKPTVSIVVHAFGVKNVALTREVAYSCNSCDITSPSYLLLGLPMMGRSPAAEGLMKRVRLPERTMSDFMDGRMQCNQKLLSATESSGDAELDNEAYSKTMAEVERGVLKGPFHILEEIPLDDVALVPRHGLWEQHGRATQRSCRCIDDMLAGEQNNTVGTVSSHRPTDPDGLVTQARAVRRRFPALKLLGWPCDLEKAYKQASVIRS